MSPSSEDKYSRESIVKELVVCTLHKSVPLVDGSAALIISTWV
jgi:hypothetical protein